VQAACPECTNKLLIDDAKVPDRPFQVKCPKCGTFLKFPGRPAPLDTPGPPSARPSPVPGEEFPYNGNPDETIAPSALPPVAPPPPASAAPAAPAVAAPAPPVPRRAPKAAPPAMPAPASSSVPSGGGDEASVEAAPETTGRVRGHALVAFPGGGPGGAITGPLTRLGFAVDRAESHEDAILMVEQGSYAIVATARVGLQPPAESLYQRVARLPADARRRMLLVLVADEFKTAEPTQAFAVLADLVLQTKDTGSSDVPLKHTLNERKRLYQAFEEARRKVEASDED
jgi:predicted Zn finger-like uncharacterized protein